MQQQIAGDQLRVFDSCRAWLSPMKTPGWCDPSTSACFSCQGRPPPPPRLLPTEGPRHSLLMILRPEHDRAAPGAAAGSRHRRRGARHAGADSDGQGDRQAQGRNCHQLAAYCQPARHQGDWLQKQRATPARLPSLANFIEYQLLVHRWYLCGKADITVAPNTSDTAFSVFPQASMPGELLLNRQRTNCGCIGWVIVNDRTHAHQLQVSTGAG